MAKFFRTFLFNIYRFLGFKMLEGEYKMMGLAPYGKPVYKDLILDKILNLKNGGRYKLNIEICDYHAALRGEFHKELSKLFGEKRLENQIPTQNHINLACSVQLAFEECLKHILSLAVEQYPNIKACNNRRLCFKCYGNGKLISSNFVDNVIIPPAPHDAGCAIGAGLCAIKTNINSQSVRTPFLGRKFSRDFIFNELIKYCDVRPKELEENELIQTTVKYLIEGKLIAWFQGGAEFGPRALGARSFLADPRNDNIRNEINQKIKKRELFRPFAPCCFTKNQKDSFKLIRKSIYEYCL